MIKHDEKRDKNENSIVYKIPCNTCHVAYYGETARGVHKRLTEHKNDLKTHRLSNSLVIHADKYGHLPNWEKVEVLHEGHDRTTRKIIEAAYISTNDVSNHRMGFINLTKAASHTIINEAKSRELNRGPLDYDPRTTGS